MKAKKNALIQILKARTSVIDRCEVKSIRAKHVFHELRTKLKGNHACLANFPPRGGPSPIGG